MVFDRNGKKRRHEFLRGMMRSAARLTYTQVQHAFDGKSDPSLSAVARWSRKYPITCYASCSRWNTCQ